MKLKIPNILTIGRIIIVPIFVLTFFIPGFFGDLIPFDLEKKDKMKDMIKQYEYWADQLGMDSIEELMAISYSLARMHLLLHRVTPERTDEMKVHIMSSATAQYISGYRGFKKYLMKLVSKDWYSVTYGPHPQESPR